MHTQHTSEDTAASESLLMGCPSHEQSIRSKSNTAASPGMGGGAQKHPSLHSHLWNGNFSGPNHFIITSPPNPKSDQSTPLHPDPLWGSGPSSIPELLCLMVH